MTTEYVLDRRTAVPRLIGNHQDFLFVTGLGSSSRDIAHLTGNGPHLFALGGAMGASLSMGLGLALARPDKKVMVVTGDGELLMCLGTLATIAPMNPRNLSVLCVDNGHYLETGGQITHTGRGTDLEMIAQGAGFKRTATIKSESDYAEGRSALYDEENASFVLVKVAPTEPPENKRNLDAYAAKLRMKAFLAQ